MRGGARNEFSNKTACPVCGSPCASVRTNPVTPVYREITYRCRNGACGHIFIAGLSPVRTLLPSLLDTGAPDGSAPEKHK